MLFPVSSPFMDWLLAGGYRRVVPGCFLLVIAFIIIIGGALRNLWG